MKGFVEKRKFRRIPVNGTADVTWNGQSYSGSLSDLSLLGAMVNLSAPIPVGDSLKVFMHIGNGHDITIVVEGVVARNITGGIGIRFTSIDVVSLSRLKNIFEFNALSIEHLIENYLVAYEMPGLLPPDKDTMR